MHAPTCFFTSFARSSWSSTVFWRGNCNDTFFGINLMDNYLVFKKSSDQERFDNPVIK
jgi:hypothetical protein